MAETRDLQAFLGGMAASGAVYKIEIVDEGDGDYSAWAANAGNGAAWGDLALIVRSPDLAAVIKKANARFVEKTRPGRDRVYSRPIGGGLDAGPYPKGLDVIASSPLAWAIGRPLSLLPAELRHRAILGTGQAADDDAPPPTYAAAVPGERPPLGQVVMLCETLPNAAALDLLLEHDGWAMTEKMEGDRGQLHCDEDGMVYLTKRSGELANCPPHIARSMEALGPGVSLDGELITVDEEGRAQLYVGGMARISLFVAFDLLAHPEMPGGMGTAQGWRLALLARKLPSFTAPLAVDGPAIRCVPHAYGLKPKWELFKTIRARQGEGVVMRKLDAAYEGRRSAHWMRYCDRERTIDAVVMSYKAGTGNIAGLVGGVEVGLYDEAGVLHSIGFAGSGWTRDQRAELQARWDAGETGYVVEVKTYGLSFADQLTRPSGVRIRAAGDKRPAECRFQSEIGRPYNAMDQALGAAA